MHFCRDVLGKNLYYKVSGIDLTPYLLTRLPEYLNNNGVQVGSLYLEDFLNFNSTQQFDVVCSFGFIEHFTNFELVFQKHIDLVKPGGILVVACPNFNGLQKLFHAMLDYDNLKRHVLAAMDLQSWGKILKKNDMEIIYHGYYRTADFWAEIPKNQKTRLRLGRLLSWATKKIDRYVDFPNPWLSPYMISFSRKPLNS